jgi:hypothetical protein
MNGHRLAESTHTLVMRQTREIADTLSGLPDERRQGLTAAALGMTGETARTVTALRRERPRRGIDDPTLRLPAGDVLEGIRVEGCPDFPYVWGRFASPSHQDGPDARTWLEAALHTDALRRLSRFLGLRHRWGLGS